MKDLAIPQVGIFWLLLNNKISCSVRSPFTKAFSTAATLFARLGTRTIGNKCAIIFPPFVAWNTIKSPRGRVIKRAAEDLFVVLSSRRMIGTDSLRQLVAGAFCLTDAMVAFDTDEHYELRAKFD